MPNPMDAFQFNQATCTMAPNIPCDLMSMVQQARQNPRAFEEQFKRTNPQAYQQAMQIRQSGNPRAYIMQMLQARGINPGILQMLGL